MLPGIGTFAGVSAANSVIVLLWCIFYLIYHYFERYNLSLKRQAEINEIELNNLKSQLNPHFIFNSLNSIRALVDEDPKKSKLAITQLSTILRSSLASDQSMLTGFDDELLTVKNYLGLESIRYEERLRVSYDIDPASQRFMIPPLMLQTLVENGIKHGISQLKQGGEICICTKVDNDKLNIEIRNSGKLKQLNGHSKRRKGGLGLHNTRKRLALIYGDEAHFDIRNMPEGGVSTELIIPLNTLENESNNRRR
jgi:LytS/YehU family sensor histidine kinase